jgi:hypothetical protein
MSTSFINRVAKEVGTTPVSMYTTPSNSKAILIGVNIANVTGSTVPFDIYIDKGGTDYYIAKSHRVLTGDNVEIMKGNKIVLDNDDIVYVKSDVGSSIDVILSILSGVT